MFAHSCASVSDFLLELENFKLGPQYGEEEESESKFKKGPPEARVIGASQSGRAHPGARSLEPCATLTSECLEKLGKRAFC